MVLRRIRKKISPASSRLPKPKISTSRFGQLFFTIKETTKLAARINKKYLILVFTFSALWGFLAAPGFILEKLIIDRLIESVGNSNIREAIAYVGIVVAARLLLELVRNILSRINGFLTRALSRMFEAEVGLLVGKKLGELDMATIEDPDFKNKFDKIQRESGRRSWGLIMPLTDIPNYSIGFLSSVAILFLLSPWVALGVFLFSIPQVFIDRKYIKKDYELHTQLTPKYRIWGWLNNYLVRNRNYMEAKILGLSGYLSKRLKIIQKEVIGKRTQLQRKRETSRFWSFLPLSLYEFGISLWLVYLVIIETITVGSFEMFLRALRSTQMNLTGLVSAFMEIYENYIYVADLVWFLGLESDIEHGKGGKDIDMAKSQSIVGSKLWFRYRDDQPWIIKGVDLKIEPGERIALVGENGVGKTTLIKLIARFYDPQKGKLFYGEEELKDLNLTQWRTKLGILFQMFEAYPFSSKETIGYGDVARIDSMDEIKEAAKKAGIHEYIESLPLKYNNPLAPELEKGVHPSSGQWQRLGISRMLFRKSADILILDEPTSNVDPKAEEQIFNELLKEAKGKIFIFVSQRFSTVRRADRILVMDKGEIAEQGTHEDLLKKKGLYAELFNLQAKRYR